MKTVYICVISKQQLQNYIPIHIFKPTDIYLLASATKDPDITENPETLKKVLINQGFATVKVITQMPEKMESLLNFLQKFKNKHLTINKETHFIVNVTGGTKIMSIALFEFFKNFPSVKMIYNNHFNNTIEFLSPANLPDQTMNYYETNLNHFLNLHRVELTHNQPVEIIRKRQAMTKMIAQNPESMVTILRKCINKDSTLKLAGNRIDELIGLLKACNLIFTRAPNIASLNFLPDAKKYIDGQWLEEYIWLCLQDIPEVYDVRCSINLLWSTHKSLTPPKNEIDIAFLYHNQLFIIECKTGKDQEGKELQNTINTLKSLGEQFGGSFHGLGLVTLKPIVSNEHFERAKSMKISIFNDAQGLKNIKQQLIDWIQKTKK